MTWRMFSQGERLCACIFIENGTRIFTGMIMQSNFLLPLERSLVARSVLQICIFNA